MMRKLWPLLALLLLPINLWAAHWERDQSGRSVAIPDHVHRVVSLAPSLTDTVYALGAASELAGITNYTDYPPQAAHEKPSVGAVVGPSLERIVALHPDLVLALPEFNGAETIAGLERLNVPVLCFETGNVAGIYRTVADVGRALGRRPEATRLIAELQAREKKVRDESAGQKRPSVLLVLSIDPLITAGKNAFITEMITVAGARSVTEDLPQDWLQMNVEAILPRDPDYILLMNNGPVTLNDLQQHAGWNSLAAVRRGRVMMLDARIQVPAPVAFDGLEVLARQIRAAQGR
ncbi:MAG TPA: helical backbone metal receptor [Bryocella sp.]|nr:helical backbone metal receptor [Bryocella sp.]